MKKLLCKVFGHSVETTHTNQWQIPTREKCTRCGLVRSMEKVPETNCFQWVYSDGRKSIGLTATRIDGIEFGDLQ
jgi:hypothetical protein